MAKPLTQLVLFVSCPEEMSVERELVSSAVGDLNPFFEKHSKTQISVSHWKNSVIPGVADAAQTVISAQLNEYDIYVGIMGTRFGSPTPSFGSGTEQEFEEAYKRFTQDPTKVWVMFYFSKSI